MSFLQVGIAAGFEIMWNSYKRTDPNSDVSRGQFCMFIMKKVPRENLILLKACLMERSR